MLLFGKGTHIGGYSSQQERTFRSLAKQKAIESLPFLEPVAIPLLSKIFWWKPRSLTATLTLAVGAPSIGVPVVTSAYNCHDPTVSAIVAPHLYMLLFSKGTHIAGSSSQHELSHERTFRSLAKQKAIESRLRIPLWKPRSLTPQ